MDKEKILQTLIVLSMFLLIVFFITNKIYFVYFSFVLLLLGLFENPLAKLIVKYWFCFSEFIGKISSLVLLSIVFFLVLTPLALLRRIFNKNSVSYFFDNFHKSFFKDKNTIFDKEYFEKKW